MSKKAYTQPQLSVHGNVETLTQKTKVGTKLDASFEAGTPLTELTIS
ncbi:hypothetical protein Sta7437_0771 [Stanieria cyanosphaera PCC 7437]|uniref:Uncharacterized protein n=1 Tax=Stanieria cyanosphaera (strain ATCC 29371 / PCC 7437) TaxID=111780 RepID=K9XRQ4_STAC7|nr:hypothetical protein [Stanieria cyanosphaera]AFZ34362.1 hypothetical protein Sta7437_0771 [Stanieria cyanosphaera PCC 7437]